MEKQNPEYSPHHNNQINKYSRKGSNSHISMSSTDSQASQLDSFHSPLRFDSPLRSDDPFFPPSPSTTTNSKAMITYDKYFSPLRSPHKPSSEHINFPPTPGTPPPVVPPPPPTKKGAAAAAAAEMVCGYSRTGGVREGVKKVERRDEEFGGGDWEEEEVVERGEGGRGVRGGGGERKGEGEGGRGVRGGGGERKVRPGVDSILKRGKREGTMKKSALGFRVCEMVVCVVSFSVMAADKTQGWAGDSYDRYKEYRYCLAVNVIGFVYAAFQTFDLACSLASGKHIMSHLHYHFEFLMDQILAYLLMSASSSAATRVDDWVSNWGKDTFTEMATASVGMSFLAFLAFAISSLISGYNLCHRDSS